MESSRVLFKLINKSPRPKSWVKKHKTSSEWVSARGEPPTLKKSQLG